MPAEYQHRESRSDGKRSAFRDESGYALLWVIFGFVVMGSIAAAALLGAGIERQSAKAVADWGTNLYVAEAGLQDVMATVQDSALDGMQPGDSLVFGPTALSQGGTYRGVIHRVDNGGQRLYNVLVEGKRRASHSSGLKLAMLAERAVPAPAAAVSVGGDLLVSGSPRITGTCGGISVGGRLTVTGELAVQGEIAATDILVSGGSVVTTTGQKVNLTKQSTTPEDVPGLNTDQTCDTGTSGNTGGGEYEREGSEIEFESGGYEFSSEGGTIETEGTLRDGYVHLDGGLVTMPACYGDGTCSAEEELVYKESLNSTTYDGTQYVMDGTAPTGTLCADDDVLISGNLGTQGSPETVSILTDGSMEISGNPYLVPDDPEGLLIQTDGDLVLNGNGDLVNPNFTGDIYALGQCAVGGTPALLGQLACANQPIDAAAAEKVSQSEISGSPLIHYDCPAGSSGAATGSLRPISRRAWRQIY